MIGRGARRALAGLSWAFDAVSRAILYVDIATRPLSAMRAATRDIWSDFNVDAASVDAGWTLWEQRLVDQFVAADDRVLLVGSGTGRDLIPFVEMGCRVTGVEPAPQAVEAATRALGKRNLAATLIEGFIEDVPLEGAFDLIMFSYWCYSYMFDSARRVDALLKLRRHLSEGGRVLLTCHCVSHDLQPRSRLLALARVANRWRQPGWRLEAGDWLGRIYGRTSMFQYVHFFTRRELEGEANAGGFSLEPTDVHDAYVLRPRSL